MSELELKPFPSELNPGNVFRFANMHELVAFEDLLAPIVDPIADVLVWQARPNLIDLLRPRDFIGTIRGITLTSMHEPYKRLLDARERGWKMKRGISCLERTQTGSEQFIDQYLGFVFDAEARSTNPALRGRVAAELWYYEMPKKLVKAGTVITSSNRVKNGELHKSTSISGRDSYTSRSGKMGEEIRRVVTRPAYNKGEFEQAQFASKAIGFAVLASAMRNAISTPMRN